jgi:hypothetical protein
MWIEAGMLVCLTRDSSKRSSDQTLSEPGRGAGPLSGRGSVTKDITGGQSSASNFFPSGSSRHETVLPLLNFQNQLTLLKQCGKVGESGGR